MRYRITTIIAIAALASFPVHGGHEAPIYPSYYPQEIQVEPVEPAEAGRLLENGKIHAYIGRQAVFAGAAPKSVRAVESLGSFVVVRVHPTSPKATDERAACAVAGTVLRALAGAARDFVVHPYPVTPFHGDYLHHVDRAEAARERFLKGPAAPVVGVTVRATGAMAESVARGLGAAPDGSAEADASVEEIDLTALLAGQRVGINGWLGPPWLKQGWFHAYLLLGPALGDTATRERAAQLAARLQAGATADSAESINFERDLVGLLTAGCRTVAAGYAVKREHYSAAYSEGIENIAYDSHAGLNSAIFLRTVKLKDFPWNGWLRLGVPSPPAAAWNPFGGFNDEAGRLLWLAIGDPALFPEPYGGGWILNRIGDVRRPVGR